MKVLISGLLMVLRGILWILLMGLHIALEGIKIMFLLWGLVMRLFLAVVRAGTP